MKTLKYILNLILLLILNCKNSNTEDNLSSKINQRENDMNILFVYPEQKNKESNLTVIFAEPYVEASTEHQDDKNKPKVANTATYFQNNKTTNSLNVDEIQSKDTDRNQTQENIQDVYENNSTIFDYERFNLKLNNTSINLENNDLNTNSTMNSFDLPKTNNDIKKSNIKIKSDNPKLLQLLNSAKSLNTEKIQSKITLEIIKKSDVHTASNEKMEGVDQLEAEGSDHQEISLPFEDISSNEPSKFNPPEIIPFTLQDAMVNKNMNIEDSTEWRLFDRQQSENVKRYNNKKLQKKYNSEVFKSKEIEYTKNQDEYKKNKVTLGYLLSMWSGFTANGEPVMHKKLHEEPASKTDRTPRQTLLIIGPIPKSLPASLYRTKYEPFKNQLGLPKNDNIAQGSYFLTQ